ncbi:hypothetical protein [Paraburkholderia humisilvae]|uniref:hypothetical protein n=1 Tax=Paraburkholderia humisilvae TaxID=627669 RepID=UPI0035E7091C
MKTKKAAQMSGFLDAGYVASSYFSYNFQSEFSGESWHLWRGVALVWFFRFCYISTGKAADLSTGYPHFQAFPVA